MPAKSKAQQRLMAMAEHNPEKVWDKNKGVLGMSKQQLRDFAKTKTKELPSRKSKNTFLNMISRRKNHGTC